jgi:threonine dehydrogenase-like Zn-dependent dehydrogenase
MVGFVEAIDVEDSDLKVGDEVLALAPEHRAMAEYYLAPLEHVLPLPAGLPLEQLLQAQQLGTVLYACQRLPNLLGKTVAVIGQGSAGLWFNFQLRRMGARKVIALDTEKFRLTPSAFFGATHTVHNAARDPLEAIQEITGGELADLVVEAAGEIHSINLAIDLVRPEGDILYFGFPRAQTFEYHFDKLFHKCCRTTTVVGAAVENNQTSTRLALELLASGSADAKPLITHRFGFDDVLDAYEMHRTRADGAIKIIIEMSD